MSEWISFSEEHPPEGSRVLLFDEGEMNTADISNGNLFVDGMRFDMDISMKNSYWMSLPEPPTGDD